jgi:hypothetical protein
MTPAMYALRDAASEERLNTALSRYLSSERARCRGEVFMLVWLVK